jgi:hypothetical protein
MFDRYIMFQTSFAQNLAKMLVNLIIVEFMNYWRLRVKAMDVGGSWANITGHASGRFLTVYSRLVQES